MSVNNDGFLTYEDYWKHPSLSTKERDDLWNFLVRVKGVPPLTSEQTMNAKNALKKVAEWEARKREEAMTASSSSTYVQPIEKKDDEDESFHSFSRATVSSSASSKTKEGQTAHNILSSLQPSTSINGSGRSSVSSNGPSTKKELKGYEKYKALLSENQIDKERELITPKRRICGFGAMSSPSTQALVTQTVFIKDDEIIKVHPMRFLRNSPFVQETSPRAEQHYSSLNDNDPYWDLRFEDLVNKELHAIGRTENGKHVILQQAAKSCVPTCIGMLVLDHGKTPDYEAIRYNSLANEKQAVEWVEMAGLKPQMTTLEDPKNSLQTLIGLIKRYGSGVLGIVHPQVRGHVIVLDEICEKTRTAIIRDSAHGWALTIKLDSLLSWLSDHNKYFLQICPSDNKQKS